MSTRTMTLIHLVMLGVAGAFLALTHHRIPDMVPIHWDLQGNPDDWAPKWVGLGGALSLTVFSYLFALIAPWLSPKPFEVDSWRHTFNYIMTLVGLLGVFIFFVTAQAALYPAFTGILLIRALTSGMLIWMGLLGNVLGKTRKNFWVGIRSPWTLASEQVWIKTHRFAARLLVAVGLLGGVLIWIGLHPLVGLGALMLALFIPVFYSLLLYKRLHPNGSGLAALLALGALGSLGCGHQQVSATTFAPPAIEAGEHQVKFQGEGGFELLGTLLLPEAKGPVPAVLLLPGSGPTNRDGNQAPVLVTDLLKQIAQRLADNGIASLRFDKRAVPGTYASRWPEEKEFIDFFSWESFVGDGRGALDFMRARPEIDPKKVFVAGHSEGGMIALQLGADLPEAQKPAGLILLAAPGRSLDAVIVEQVEAALTAQKAPKEVHDEYMSLTRKAIASIKGKKQVPNDLPAGLQPLFPAYAAKLLYSYFTFDPQSLAARYPGPVLILQGDKDQQVAVERDAKQLHSFFERRPDSKSELLVLTETSHNLKKVGGQAGGHAFEGPVVEPALIRIVDWLKLQAEAG